MNPTLAAGAVSGGVALVVAVWTAVWTTRLSSFNAKSAESLKRMEEQASKALEDYRQELARAAKQEESELSSRAVLSRYREPLLAAAESLGHRLNNIRSDHFFDRYLRQEEHRRQLALQATMFRFARYLGWVAVLEREVNYLHFETEQDTKTVALMLKDVGTTLATDLLDAAPGRSARLMLWREEQQAIGGLMLCNDEVGSVIGFESFVRDYNERFAPWFVTFAEDLEWSDINNSQRLAQLQRRLAVLVRQLDDEGLYQESSTWVANDDASDGEHGARP